MRMTECSKYCQKMQMGDHLTGMDPSNWGSDPPGGCYAKQEGRQGRRSTTYINEDNHKSGIREGKHFKIGMQIIRLMSARKLTNIQQEEGKIYIHICRFFGDMRSNIHGSWEDCWSKSSRLSHKSIIKIN
jgi:hypothetical protein